MASSTVGPKIARKIMLPKMCRKPACRNIEVKTVSQAAGCGAGVPVTPGWPWQAIDSPTPVSVRRVISSQCLPGCVSS